MISNLQLAIAPVFEALDYKIAWPNVHCSPDALNKFRQQCREYLKIDYLFAQSERQTLNCGRQPGIIQCSVYTLDGIGAITCSDIADEVIALFPMGSEFVREGTTVHIDSPPYPSGGLNDNGWYFIPVSIPFEVQI